MGFKGSIVIKKTRLMDLADDLQYYWNSSISDGARSVVFGQKITFERIAEGEFSKPGLREYAAFNWYDPAQNFGAFWLLPEEDESIHFIKVPSISKHRKRS